MVYSLNCGNAVPETITKYGGSAVRNRIGHSFIKATMREKNAIFGGESSGHYYFRDNFYADSALITVMLVLELMSLEEKPLSELTKEFKGYYLSGEINSVVDDKEAKLKLLEEKYTDGEKDYMDGLTITYPDYWFNVRPSNTEPLLRLNLEAKKVELGKDKVAEILELLRN